MYYIHYYDYYWFLNAGFLFVTALAVPNLLCSSPDWPRTQVHLSLPLGCWD